MKKMNGMPTSFASDEEPGYRNVGPTEDINAACDRYLRRKGVLSDGELAFKARIETASKRRWAHKNKNS